MPHSSRPEMPIIAIWSPLFLPILPALPTRAELVVFFEWSEISAGARRSSANLKVVKSDEARRRALTRGSFGDSEFSRMVTLYARAACRRERHQERFLKVDEVDR